MAQQTQPLTARLKNNALDSSAGSHHLRRLREILVKGAYERRDVWPHRKQAMLLLRRRKSGNREFWRSLLGQEYGIVEHRRLLFFLYPFLFGIYSPKLAGARYAEGAYPGVIPACSRDPEAAMYHDPDGATKPVECLNRIARTRPVHLIFGVITDCIPKRVHKAIIDAALYASVAILENAGHLVATSAARRARQTRSPGATAGWVCRAGDSGSAAPRGRAQRAGQKARGGTSARRPDRSTGPRGLAAAAVQTQAGRRVAEFGTCERASSECGTGNAARGVLRRGDEDGARVVAAMTSPRSAHRCDVPGRRHDYVYMRRRCASRETGKGVREKEKERRGEGKSGRENGGICGEEWGSGRARAKKLLVLGAHQCLRGPRREIQTKLTVVRPRGGGGYKAGVTGNTEEDEIKTCSLPFGSSGPNAIERREYGHTSGLIIEPCREDAEATGAAGAGSAIQRGRWWAARIEAEGAGGKSVQVRAIARREGAGTAQEHRADGRGVNGEWSIRGVDIGPWRYGAIEDDGDGGCSINDSGNSGGAAVLNQTDDAIKMSGFSGRAWAGRSVESDGVLVRHWTPWLLRPCSAVKWAVATNADVKVGYASDGGVL
ncbi:hypothetical protein C8R47DRAFT_1303311 [Mycena vitilis]|nr:hypothetical protein C8R47DRAFT_1303311 [Mycena vitilis]